MGQLQTILNNTLAQIQSLRNQITQYSNSVTKLEIPGLQTQLTSIINNLQIAYNAYNAGNIDLTPYNLNLTANLQSIANLTQQREMSIKQTAADNQSLTDTNILIDSLEGQLAAAKKNRDTLAARILVQTSTTSTLTQNVDFLNADNVRLNNRLN